MRAFPQELRDLAVAAERAQAKHHTAHKAYSEADPQNRADENIAREIACIESVAADDAFRIALKDYLASQKRPPQ